MIDDKPPTVRVWLRLPRPGQVTGGKHFNVDYQPKTWDEYYKIKAERRADNLGWLLFLAVLVILFLAF